MCYKDSITLLHDHARTLKPDCEIFRSYTLYTIICITLLFTAEGHRAAAVRAVERSGGAGAEAGAEAEAGAGRTGAGGRVGDLATE